MSDEAKKPQPAERKPLPRWKKVAMGVAALFVVIGLSLSAFGSSGGGSGDAGAVTGPGGQAAGFLPGQPGGESTQSSAADESPSSWSPFFVKGGFGFFVGFCIGYALRTFFKVSAVAVGLMLLVLFGLSYAGVIDVDWATMEGHFDTLVTKIKGEAQEFKSFITGSLPSAALASFGLVTGFKRN